MGIGPGPPTAGGERGGDEAAGQRPRPALDSQTHTVLKQRLKIRPALTPKRGM